MSGYGDTEPEDEWTVTDDVHALVANLRRRAMLLSANRTGWIEPGGDLATQLDQLDNIVRAVRHWVLDARDVLRLEQLADDIPVVRARLAEAGR